MRDIVGFNTQRAVGTFGDAAMSGARATDTTGFTRRVMEWADLPAQSRAFDEEIGELLDGAVLDMTGHARKIDGRPHQVCVGWRAYLDRIVVVRAARALIERPDGRLSPDGPWMHNQGTVYPVVAAKRTTGTVPSTVGPEAQEPKDAAMQDVPAEQRRAAKAQTHLPLPVQATITRAVPDPEVWLDAFWQLTQGGAPSKQHLGVLRLAAGSAVLAVAERTAERRVRRGAQADAYFRDLAWQVTQVEFTLGPGVLLSAPPARTQIGGNR